MRIFPRLLHRFVAPVDSEVIFYISVTNKSDEARALLQEGFAATCSSVASAKQCNRLDGNGTLGAAIG
jgi:hypothetical protein